MVAVTQQLPWKPMTTNFVLYEPIISRALRMVISYHQMVENYLLSFSVLTSISIMVQTLLIINQISPKAST